MKTVIQRLAKSLGFGVPKVITLEARLTRDTPIDISIENDNVITIPFIPETPRLGDLNAEITQDNRHEEWETGLTVGREIY